MKVSIDPKLKTKKIIFIFLYVVFLFLLSACSNLQTKALLDWQEYTQRYVSADAEEKQRIQLQLQENYQEDASSDIALKLGFAYLQQPENFSYEQLKQIEELINQEKTSLPFAVIKRQLSLQLEAQQNIFKLNQKLQHIDASACKEGLESKANRENENTPYINELETLRQKLSELQNQLQVLKSIDDDLTKSRQAIDQLTQ